MRQLKTTHSYARFLGTGCSEDIQFQATLHFTQKRDTMGIISKLKNKRIFTPKLNNQIKHLSYAELQEREINKRQETARKKAIKRIKSKTNSNTKSN